MNLVPACWYKRFVKKKTLSSTNSNNKKKTFKQWYHCKLIEMLQTLILLLSVNNKYNN